MKNRVENTSSVKGVSWDGKRRKWVAQICLHQKRYNLGRFSNFDDAVAARKKAEEKLFESYRSELKGLKKVRVEKGYTQQKLSEISGVPKRTIQDWEAGKRNPKIDGLKRIAEVLGVDVGSLKVEKSTQEE